MGISVIYNLLFLLTAFLCSEGLKSYKFNFAVIIIVVGVLQLVRIFGIPTQATNTLIMGSTDKFVMESEQFVYTVSMLVISAVCCIASGVIGIIRTNTLREFNGKIASGEVVLEYKD
jgi:hypothetical protein